MAKRESDTEKTVTDYGESNVTQPPESVEQSNLNVKKEPRFSVAELRARSRTIFGVSQSTFDGAMLRSNKDVKYTIAEVKEIIAKWGGAPAIKKKEEK